MSGGAISVFIPRSSEIALLAVLALAVTPLALIAAINPRFSVAPVTAIIVLFDSHNDACKSVRFGT